MLNKNMSKEPNRLNIKPDIKTMIIRLTKGLSLFRRCICSFLFDSITYPANRNMKPNKPVTN